MSDTSIIGRGSAHHFSIALLIGTTALVALSFQFRQSAEIAGLDWLYEYPKEWVIPFQAAISDAMYWLVEDATLGLFTVRDIFRAVSFVTQIPLDLAMGALATGIVEGSGGNARQVVEPISWISVVLIVACIGHYAAGWRLAFFAAGCFLYLALFGQWDSAMLTLSSILVAVPLGALVGPLLGVAAYQYKWVESLLKPILDLMQTVPVFAYLVPILFLFGFGPVSAMIATLIYAMPPMVRASVLALRSVPAEIDEFGRMSGCNGFQRFAKVLVPSARPTLMIGLNQVIMLSLNMVIIASMIGAGGLGYDVLTALRRLDVGGGLEAGIAIVVLALAIDRLSHGVTAKRPSRYRAHKGMFVRRYPRTLLCLASIAVTYGIGQYVHPLLAFPENWQVSMSTTIEDAVRFINVNYYDTLEQIKLVILQAVMLPVRYVLTTSPWILVYGLVLLIAARVGGLRLCVLCGLLLAFILFTGQWAKAMTTVYLCGVSVLFAILLGVPLGILGSGNERIRKMLFGLTDTLQTLPSFVYLIPVIMFFQSGDFSAMIAVVLYAMAPVIRYTADGLSSVDPALIEAGKTSGCTKRQLFLKIRLPLAAPVLMLGLNQTIMLALSMVVITALVGTRDLGQEVFTALQRADVGLGLVAGLSVAFIAITADRLLSFTAQKMRG